MFDKLIATALIASFATVAMAQGTPDSKPAKPVEAKPAVVAPANEVAKEATKDTAAGTAKPEAKVEAKTTAASDAKPAVKKHAEHAGHAAKAGKVAEPVADKAAAPAATK